MLNKAILIGRLTADPLTQLTDNRKIFLQFTLAVDDGWGDNKRTYFIQCKAWNKTAEFISDNFLRGDLLVVSDGKIAVDTWEDNNLRKHFLTYVLVNSVEFGGCKKEADGSGT